MPTYEYECQGCGEELEIFQSMKDDPLKKCPSCKKNKLKRKIGTGAGIIFKGSGFYETDYRSENYKKAAEKDKPSSDSGEKKSDSTKKKSSSEKKKSSEMKKAS